MTDHDDNDDKRTEGVRIIGAQEAAEAAGRPDVVRRRRRSEKRFGDRPDRPEADSDLPKITISTTESDGTRGDAMGSVPIVRPGSAGPEPDWAEDSSVYGPTDDSGERINVGHARIVPADVTGEAGSDADDDDTSYSSASDLGDWSEDDATQAWDESPATDSRYRPATQGDDIYSNDVYKDDVYGDATDGGEYSEDDSFVLPHWTEPPTGQVPKVVIGDSGGEPTGSVDYVSQPRWRGEGERSSATDFGDLLDDGPRLGA
ncbi:MAG TPA: hypothetical protein VL068_08540, partial [Microthrixaceae bacterium]|nr:hypothetical protein [Microthrixaceae bacterium]